MEADVATGPMGVGPGLFMADDRPRRDDVDLSTQQLPRGLTSIEVEVGCGVFRHGG